jgi:hypothetical protein
MRVAIGAPTGAAVAAARSIVQLVCSIDIGENNPRFDCQDGGLR